MEAEKKHIPQNQRRNILLICDDIRTPSGVAQIGREIVINTCHKYNYIQVAGAIHHPEKGKRIDLSEDINKQRNLSDSKVHLIPTDGYGDPDLIRYLLKTEKIDAIFLITDPRYFGWLFRIENEIRKQVPIIYLNIWDSPPAPHYNREYYESCDLLMSISKQTKNLNRLVLDGGEIAYDDLDVPREGWKEGNRPPILLKYVPHGVNSSYFYPIETDTNKPNELDKLNQFRNIITKGKEYDFILLYNSRNIRRKSAPDTVLAWKLFLESIPKEKAERCLMIMHTEPSHEAGTDLVAVVDYLFGEENKANIIISNNKFSTYEMNLLYNMVDGVILLSSNEGWGLALTEALLTGTPFIANVTGGMQDQMRFIDNEGKWFTPSADVPSNHKKTYTECGEWALPVFPTNLSLLGSVPTPYIFDDRCSFEDAFKRISELYSMSKEERRQKGMKGREWALGEEAGFTSQIMCDRIIESVDTLFSRWKPREKYEFLKDTDYKPRILNHKLLY
jgi:glycosyltransferase involved in cell wall biosynthesis